jgi:hypothetical protein
MLFGLLITSKLISVIKKTYMIKQKSLNHIRKKLPNATKYVDIGTVLPKSSITHSLQIYSVRNNKSLSLYI